jgi:hypothetical protein
MKMATNRYTETWSLYLEKKKVHVVQIWSILYDIMKKEDAWV